VHKITQKTKIVFEGDNIFVDSNRVENGKRMGDFMGGASLIWISHVQRLGITQNLQNNLQNNNRHWWRSV
jgi:hypothetical protein